MSLYLILLFSSVAVPFFLSFDKRLQFYRKWSFVLPAIFIVAAVYIIFDIYLTKQGVWAFNPRYLSGINLINLPLEEWLFFIVIAYASLFLHYTVVEYFPKAKLNRKTTKWLTIILLVFSVLMVLVNISKAYTSYIFIKMVVALCLSILWKSKSISAFYITFLVILIPFTVVNGILTGSFIEDQVVWYNNNENLGIRFFTIPAEDFAYAFSMLLFNLLLLDKLKDWRNK
jgi:lycopene cyclase domain-containing protein